MTAQPDPHPVAVFHLRVKRRLMQEQLCALGRQVVPGESIVRTWQRLQAALKETQTGAA